MSTTTSGARLPNILTVARLAAAPFVLLVFVALPRPSADLVACVLFAAAAATDWIDGRLARRWNVISPLGRMLDPIADKAVVAIALAALVGIYGTGWEVAPPAAAILLRETIIAGLREHLAGALSLPVTVLAKWKTASQMTAITLLLGAGAAGAFADTTALVGAALLWVSAALTLITGWDYLTRAIAHVRAAE